MVKMPVNMTKRTCYDSSTNSKQKERSEMTKRFFVSIAVACTLIFSVGLQAPVHAASVYTPDQETQEKVENNVSELLKGKWNEQMFNAFHQYFQNCFPQSDRNDDAQVEDTPEASEDIEQQEPVEQPSNDQVEQPNQGTQPNQGEQQQAPEQQEKPAEQGELSQFEQEVIELTNVERSNHGLAPLKVDVELSNVARDKSKDMQANNYFDHTSPTYGSPFDMMRSYGISYQAAGENIAKGQQTPEEVVNAWMNSQGHRENILNGDFTHIGVGFIEQGNYWTQMFIGK